jgi:hypothetical protein
MTHGLFGHLDPVDSSKKLGRASTLITNLGTALTDKFFGNLLEIENKNIKEKAKVKVKDRRQTA